MKNHRYFPSFITILFVFFFGIACTRAELRLPNIFGDHMVLQRDKPVAVWGWADSGAKVVVEFGEQSKSAAADDSGRWTVSLDKLESSFESRSIKVTDGNDTVTIRDVLVGEVWVCGGQSNMEWTLRGSRDADVEIESADFPAIRFIRLPKIANSKPQEDFPAANPKSIEGNWRLCVPDQVDNCTAVGYYFAKRLHRRLRVPVGLVDTSWGGTMAQHWVSKETLRPIPEMNPYFEKFAAALKEWNDGGGADGEKKRYADALAAWEKKRDEARAKGERDPGGKPNRNSFNDPSTKGQPGGMLNGVIMPIAPLTIRGALFYQGENNSFTEGWKPFPKTFPAVVADWRKVFGDPDLPMGLIQIAGWSTRRSMTYDMNHHTNIVREVQHKTWQSTPNTGLVVTYDANSNTSIHPGRKLPVGERSARWALAEVYGIADGRSKKPLEWRGPVFKSMRVEGEKVILSFQEGTNRGLRLDKDVEIGFYIAGEDREFHHARARVIKDNKLEVWLDKVSNPVAVRYGWSNLPMGGLMNGRELPAYPFRTDKWPLVPHQSTGEYQVE